MEGERRAGSDYGSIAGPAGERERPPRCRAALLTALLVLVLVVVLVLVAVLYPAAPDRPAQATPPLSGQFARAAVASDGAPCAVIARDILAEGEQCTSGIA